MIIKIDCREKDLYLKLNNDNGENAKNANPAIKNKPVNEPKFHIMDLGDGMTIQVPIPQNMNKSKGKPLILIANAYFIKIQEQCTNKRLKQTPQFFQIGSRLLLFGVL